MRGGTPGAPSSRSIIVAAYATMFLIGWAGVLVATLIRDVKADFVQSDAGIGLLYFLFALLFAAGALASGLLAGRLGRPVILVAAALLLGVGLLAEGLAPTWPIFLVGAALVGAGSGGIDAAVNGVIMDLAAVGQGSALNRLHLFYSIGALTAPIAVGTLVGAGVDWRLPVLATGLVGLAMAFPMRVVGSVPARPHAAGDHSAVDRSSLNLRLPLALLGVAIATCVAVELGVSSWVVELLATESVGVATFALGLFWLGHASGRLVAVRIADRFTPVRFTASCMLFSAACLVGAVVVPGGVPRLALFAAVGLGLGPVYPMIMTVAGTLYPHRAAAVSGLLMSTGIFGSVIYPPLMGLISDTAGLGAGMLGAALLGVVCATGVVAAGRRAGGLRPPGPTPVAPSEPGSG